MTGKEFVSYAQNREDVVLWRALGSVPNGRYVEIGANDPEHFSITKAFYDRGWRGMLVDPMPSFAAALRKARPEDVVVEAAVGDEDGAITLHAIEDSGLSTVRDDVSSGHEADGRVVHDLEVRSTRLDTLLREHGFDSGPVHFLVVDVEGAEQAVLSGVDFCDWRPWVVVVEATAPLTTERSHGSWEHLLVEAGYEFTLFDGLSRFYVAGEHSEALRSTLDYPACVLDDFVDLLGADRRSAHIRDLSQRLDDGVGHVESLEAEAHEWRTRALVTWATGLAQAPDLEAHRAQVELLQLAVAQAEKKSARQAKQIKTLRRRLSESTASVREAKAPTSAAKLKDKAARTFSRGGR